MKFTLLSLLCIVSVVIFVFSDVNQATEKIEFDYVGSKGPALWHFLLGSELCMTGKSQSPIDITAEDFKMKAVPPPARFNDAEDVISTHNGNTVEISSGNEETPLPAEIDIEGETYKLQQFHFHTPSEHREDGKHHDIEQHLVFMSGTGKISVVAVFYDVGHKPSSFMNPIIENLPENFNETKKLKKVDLHGLFCDIDKISNAYTYSGSLTTPPCTEGVTWYVNRKAQKVSSEQFVKLRDAVGFNSRFTQLRANDQTEMLYPQDQYPQDQYPQDQYPQDQYPQDQYPQDQYSQDPNQPQDPYQQPTYRKRSLYRRNRFRK